MVRSTASFFFVAIFGILCIDFSSSFRFPTSAFAVKPLYNIQVPSNQRPFQKYQMGSALSCVRGGASGSHDAVVDVKDVTHLARILEEAGSDLVVLDFTASWCGPCKMIAPFYHQLATSPAYANVKFLKVDVDQASDVAEQYNVMSMPTFLFLKNKQEVNRFSGASTERLEKTVKDHM